VEAEEHTFQERKKAKGAVPPKNAGFPRWFESIGELAALSGLSFPAPRI